MTDPLARIKKCEEELKVLWRKASLIEVRQLRHRKELEHLRKEFSAIKKEAGIPRPRNSHYPWHYPAIIGLFFLTGWLTLGEQPMHSDRFKQVQQLLSEGKTHEAAVAAAQWSQAIPRTIWEKDSSYYRAWESVCMANGKMPLAEWFRGKAIALETKQ
jgi:hypothetical protein